MACSRGETSPSGHGAGGDDRRRDESVATVTARELLSKAKAGGPKAILINAWATWCDSCQHELPMLQALGDRYADRGLRVLLVSVDEPAQREEVRKFLSENQIHLTSYLAAPPLGTFKSGLNPRWPGMLPATFLFDGAGKLHYFWGGEAFEKEVAPIVDRLLAGENVDGETRFDLAPGQTSTPR